MLKHDAQNIRIYGPKYARVNTCNAHALTLANWKVINAYQICMGYVILFRKKLYISRQLCWCFHIDQKHLVYHEHINIIKYTETFNFSFFCFILNN